jgi:glyoxylase I family protein
MPVQGIGGFFFRARDPAALSRWYADYLGVGPAAGGEDPFWRVTGGPVLFQPFAEDSDYFAADRRFMLNLRVSDIDRLLFDLRSVGVAVETRTEWDDPAYGRFARIHDPEGNPIELWEPPAG